MTPRPPQDSREHYSLSLGSYGRPKMTMELKEIGLEVGERRVGRLMKMNGIKPVRTCKHKVTGPRLAIERQYAAFPAPI